jgi:hypothetical protein
MPRLRSIDLTGRNFGKLEVLEAVPGGLWRCRCLCGAFSNVRTSDLIPPRAQKRSVLRLRQGEAGARSQG